MRAWDGAADRSCLRMSPGAMLDPARRALELAVARTGNLAGENARDHVRHAPRLMATPAEAQNAQFASSAAASSISRTAAIAESRPRLWR